jgi:hypothetical protein
MAFNNEAELVRAFANSIDAFPSEALSVGARHMLVIANELSLPGAGSGGANGSADIVTVDDQGELWMIEAKLCTNPEIAPAYVFGNQLTRYARALTRTTLASLHRHFQDYAYSRRAVLRPPPQLATAWLNARFLSDMLESWLSFFGMPGKAEALIEQIDARIRTGQFVLAVLTDGPCDHLVQWSRENAERFQTAVIRLSEPDRPEVLSRTPPVAPASVFTVQDLPPFDKIPQSYKPTPSTLPLVLSETAFRLYETIVLPRLQALAGDLAQYKPEQSSTSFGYCLQGLNGLPIVLRIGRGDHYLNRGTDNAEPGQHTLKVDMVFKWACDHIFRMPPDGSSRQRMIDDLWGLTSQVISVAGYRYKNMPHNLAGRALAAEFVKGCCKRTLLVERARVNRARDFGCDNADVDEQTTALHRVFDLLEDFLGGAPATRVVPRPVRIPYKEGNLTDCWPTEFKLSAA